MERCTERSRGGYGILKSGYTNEFALCKLTTYEDTGLTPEDITRLQKVIGLKENCFRKIKSKYENLLKMWESGCNGYIELWRELTEYQDAEEQGLLHKASIHNGTPIFGYEELGVIFT